MLIYWREVRAARCTSLMSLLVHPTVRPWPEKLCVSDESRLSEGLRNGTELQGVPVPAPRVRQQREVGVSPVICAPRWNAHVKGY